MERLPAFDPNFKQVHAAPAGVIRIPPARPLHFDRSDRIDACFGDRIELVGHNLTALEGYPGVRVAGRLYRRALQAPDRDYTVFVQLVGPQGLVSQWDAQPLHGNCPTSAWAEADQIEDGFELNIPLTVEQGQYLLIAGLYDADTGERLRTPTDDHVVLQRVQLLKPG